MSLPVLVVEDRRSLAAMLAETLLAEGYATEIRHRGDEAVTALAGGGPYLAVLTDLKLPGADGLEVLRAARRLDPQLPVFLITGHASVQTAVEALKHGARDYFEKPLDMERLLVALRGAVEARRTLLAAPEAAEGAAPMVGAAPAFAAAVTALRRVAPTDTAVLLVGPSGSGKELFARAVHRLSPRAAGPFVAFNCAAVPETLVESELFGHERGSFTGAAARHLGRFEQAHRGTLFLDEVGEIPLPTQAKLLRAIEEHLVTRLGGEAEVAIDVRLVAATNRALEAAVASGAFRRDLFHRLHVFPIALPSLAQRREDIPALAEHLLERAARRHGREAPALAPAALGALVLGDWPGNVRELANLLERVLILTEGLRLRLDDLGLDPARFRTGLDDGTARRLAARVAADEVDELASFLGVPAANLRR